MTDLKEEIKIIDLHLHAIKMEYIKARTEYKPFHNTHEAYAILKEEVDELWDAIKTRKCLLEVKFEAMQIAAMALGIMVEFND